MIIKLSKHAVKMMVERGITKEQIKIAIQRGSKQRQTDGYLSLYSYFAVAWKRVNDDVYFIKTVKPNE